KKTFRIEANAKQRNRARTISVVRAASMTGKTMDVITITCCTNLVNESSGLKAHETLAPANARYAMRQMMLGGQVSVRKREKFCTVRTTQIAVTAGQKILFSIRDALRPCWSVWSSSEVRATNNGDTTKAKTHPEIATTTHVSNVTVVDLALSGSKECIGPLDILAL